MSMGVASTWSRFVGAFADDLGAIGSDLDAVNGRSRAEDGWAEDFVRRVGLQSRLRPVVNGESQMRYGRDRTFITRMKA